MLKNNILAMTIALILVMIIPMSIVSIDAQTAQNPLKKTQTPS